MSVDRFTDASTDYDLAVMMTNGLPPESRARRSWLVVQFPFEPLRDWRERRRVLSYQGVIVYSDYVRGWLQRRWGVDAVVLPPPVDPVDVQLQRKAPRILSVGRYFIGAHEKRHDALIEAFARIESRLDPEWRLVLAGGAMPDEATRGYIEQLRGLAAGHRVDVLVDVPASTLHDLYVSARIYWHATGFGRPDDRPEQAEHFGLTTIEAMSHGAVPLVYADGGPMEVVSATTGSTWRTLDELGDLTLALAGDDARLRALASEAARSVARYRFDAFAGQVRRWLATA